MNDSNEKQLKQQIEAEDERQRAGDTPSGDIEALIDFEERVTADVRADAFERGVQLGM